MPKDNTPIRLTIAARVVGKRKAERLANDILAVIHAHKGVEDLVVKQTKARVHRPRSERINQRPRARAVKRSCDGLNLLKQRSEGALCAFDGRLILDLLEAEQPLIDIGLTDHAYKRLRTAGLARIGDLRVL